MATETTVLPKIDPGQLSIDFDRAVQEARENWERAEKVAVLYREKVTEAENLAWIAARNAEATKTLYNALRSYTEWRSQGDEPRELRRPPVPAPTPEEDLQLPRLGVEQ